MSRSTTNVRKLNLKLLEVSCGDTDCPNGLHCYRQNRRLSRADQRPDGVCWSCGDDGVDWPRIHQRNPSDSSYLLQMLRTELIRHAYWEADITLDRKAYNHARRKGRKGMRDAIRSRIDKYLRTKTPFDRRQTPKTGNAIYYAQHATACCCRRCIEYWHGVPAEARLTDDQVQYFTELCLHYVNDKLPRLTEDGEHVPPDRK